MCVFAPEMKSQMFFLNRRRLTSRLLKCLNLHVFLPCKCVSFRMVLLFYFEVEDQRVCEGELLQQGSFTFAWIWPKNDHTLLQRAIKVCELAGLCETIKNGSFWKTI